MTVRQIKILKRIGYSLLLIVILSLIGGFILIRNFNQSLFKENPNYLVYSHEFKPILFNWSNDTIGNHYETKTAMNIPVKILGLPNNFYFQFDTGSPDSFIYENELKSLKDIGLNIKEVLKDEKRYVENINLLVNGNKMNVSMIRILENYGATFNKNDTINPINIGTIGTDFMDGRITVIDFKKQAILLYKERPKWMKDLTNFQSFAFKGRRLMLPATINQKELKLFYDTGTSAFGLITTKDRFDAYTDKDSREINYDANSWGDAIPIRHKKTSKIMTIGNSNLSLKRISYVDKYANFQKFMTPFTNIGGWLGNKPFINNTLIFDTKKEEFIVIEN